MSGNAKAGIWGAVITAIGTIVVALITHSNGGWHFGPDGGGPMFPIAVLDSVTKAGIPDATVSLNLPVFSSEHTDSSGQYTFQLPNDTIGKPADLVVSKDGYETYDQQIPSLNNRVTYETVYLKPTRPAGAVAVQQPISFTKVYETTPELSGAGASFSAPYELCSGNEPGYRIASSEFMLSGDRTCNQWSTCRKSVDTDSRVCWQFTLQGHNELPAPGQAISTGHLIVKWER